MLSIELTIEQGLSDDSNDKSTMTVHMNLPGVIVGDMPVELQDAFLASCVDRVHAAARALIIEPDATGENHEPFIDIGSPA
jgi:hypothetical protein